MTKIVTNGREEINAPILSLRLAISETITTINAVMRYCEIMNVIFYFLSDVFFQNQYRLSSKNFTLSVEKYNIATRFYAKHPIKLKCVCNKYSFR